MDLKQNNESVQNSTDNERITYTQLGFRSASHSNSNPDAIPNYLRIVYNQFLNEQKLDEQSIKNRINRLNAEIQHENVKKQEIRAELNTSLSRKDDIVNEIQDLELEKIEVRNGEGEVENTVPFVIGAFITLLLTLYLFVFYSSSGYSAFYGVKPGSLGFINPNVFMDAKGPGVLALIVLFPVIFLGLGFLIHDALKKISEGVNKSSSIITILVLLTITFIADAFIGYKIAEGVHNNAYNAGLTNDVWHYKMIYEDINFYLVLILGFVVYVIWGFLLNFVLSHPYLKTESQRVRLLIENLDNRISEKRHILNKIVDGINKKESDIITITEQIEQKRRDVVGYESGVIPINISSLEEKVGEFMGGWQNFTNGNFSHNQAEKLIESALINQTKWLEEKVINIKTENAN